MGILEGFWIRNFKSLKQVGIGTCFSKFVYIDDETKVLPYPLSPVTLLIGAAGTGKSSVVDSFSFVSDCYRHGIDFACLKRGGFDAIYSHGGKGSMSFGFHYRELDELEAVTYAISIASAKNNVPFIESELLVYQSGKQTLPIFFLQNGIKSIRYLAPHENLTNTDLTKIEFADYKTLGLSALESHPQFPALASLRNLFENWSLTNFTPDAARGLDLSLPRRHESPHGMSLTGLVRYIVNRYGNNNDSFFKRAAARIPHVELIIPDLTETGKPRLAFKMEKIEQPIPMTLLSDATIRFFAYAVLLEEDDPVPLAIWEELENGLDQLHCWELTEQIRHLQGKKRKPQLLLTSHDPDVADALHPAQVWVFSKNQEGFTAVERASDSFELQAVMEEEEEPIPAGWFSERFEAKI